MTKRLGVETIWGGGARQERMEDQETEPEMETEP